MLALAVALSACGESSSSDANERAGTYPVKVTEASFPTDQQLGQTSQLRIAVRNAGKHALPTLAITVGIAGKDGVASSLPFGVRDPQEKLAEPNRPVWVLAQGYPRIDGESTSAGATTTGRKTFSFGPLKPGKTTTAVWKLSAVKAGHFTLLYSIDAGLGGEAKAETVGGVTPGGSFVTEISAEPPNTEVDDSGGVVEIEK